MQGRVLAGIGVGAMAAIVAACAVLARSQAEPMLFGVRAEFLLFGLTLLGVALFHARTFEVAVTGLAFIVALKLLSAPDFHLLPHLHHEASILINLFGLLLGFAVLANHFERSEVPELMPRFLPDDWRGGFVLLTMVFAVSAFLDNIAAAMIGGTIARHVYRMRLHIGFLAAIVAASNAGGAGSVVGDTTTTMMWIDGVNWVWVLHAYAAAVPALLFLGVIAARQQQAHYPIEKMEHGHHRVRWNHLGAVVLILVGAIAANVALDFPAAGVWAAILLAALVMPTHWHSVRNAFKGSLFLIALVTCASLMPVEELPKASWHTAFGLGFLSSVFDNIPLTKLALDQGGYDWGALAYTVGFGGSMIWFGSSAGVALSNLFPEAKSVGAWLKGGWHVAAAYVLGFFVLLAVMGWHPHPPHRNVPAEAPVAGAQAHTPEHNALI